MSTKEIRDMISTAMVGDGDQVLNILEKICDKLDETERVAVLSREGLTEQDVAETRSPIHYPENR